MIYRKRTMVMIMMVAMMMTIGSGCGGHVITFTQYPRSSNARLHPPSPLSPPPPVINLTGAK